VRCQSGTAGAVNIIFLLPMNSAYRLVVVLNITVTPEDEAREFWMVAGPSMKLA
jgi:hypothetical protein